MKKMIAFLLCCITIVVCAAEPVQYRILENKDAQALSRQVQYYLRCGWRLVGPMRVQNNRFYQPIVKGGEQQLKGNQR